MRSATFELGLICYPLEIKLFVCDELSGYGSANRNSFGKTKGPVIGSNTAIPYEVANTCVAALVLEPITGPLVFPKRVPVTGRIATSSIET